MRFLLGCCLAMMAGCGYVGDPQPPALNIPQPIGNLAAVQRGGKLLLSFTLPKVTTEGLGIREFGEIEVRVGPPSEGGFETESWARTARRVPAEASDSGFMQLEAPIGEFAGREIFAAVRTASTKGRWSVWSNIVPLTIVTPLATPIEVKAGAVREGVRLTWRGATSASYRVFRQAPKEPDFSVAGDVTGPSFTDDKAEFGQSYRYRVQAIQKTGEREAESESSEVVEIAPADTFAPTVPQGISGLVGVNTIELSWERNLEKDLRGYNVYRALGEGPFTQIATGIEAPAYSDKAVEPGKSYRYTISAVDQSGNESARSEITSIAVPQ